MKRALVIIALSIIGFNLYGQYSPVSEEEVTTAEFQEITEDLDYSKTKKALRLKPFEPVEDNSSERSSGSWLNNIPFVEVLAYALILFLVAYIIFMIFSKIKIEQAPSDVAVILANEEEDIEEMDLLSALDQALAEGDYRQAVRIRFLTILQSLSLNGDIKWKPEKTNRDYTREMRSHSLFGEFKDLAKVFELIWYGNTSISKTHYEAISSAFDGFKPEQH